MHGVGLEVDKLTDSAKLDIFEACPQALASETK
jgi:hypothetical protein